MRFAALLTTIVLILCGTSWIAAQSDGDGSGGLKRPLDLPSGGAGDDEDEEDAPETISFYGSEYEGDAFFWCLDKSGSMAWGGRISILKQEMAEALASLSARAEFSMVAFSSNYVVWSPIPKKANSANKGAAIGWVQGLAANGWTCLKEAGIKTIDIANISSKRKKQLLFLGDGVPTCNGVDTSGECLVEITGANWSRIPLNTVYISTDSSGQNFFQSLAVSNGGTFTVAN